MKSNIKTSATSTTTETAIPLSFNEAQKISSNFAHDKLKGYILALTCVILFALGAYPIRLIPEARPMLAVLALMLGVAMVTSLGCLLGVYRNYNKARDTITTYEILEKNGISHPKDEPLPLPISVDSVLSIVWAHRCLAPPALHSNVQGFNFSVHFFHGIYFIVALEFL